MLHHQVNTLFEFLTKLEIYIRNGYLRYVLREIPEGKSLERIDQKILTSYQVTFHRPTRARQRDEGIGNVIYLRFDRQFVLLCCNFPNQEFDKLASNSFIDKPLYYSGYSIGVIGTKTRIQIEPKRFREIEENFKYIALQSSEAIETPILKNRAGNPVPFRGRDEN